MLVSASSGGDKISLTYVKNSATNIINLAEGVSTCCRDCLNVCVYTRLYNISQSHQDHGMALDAMHPIQTWYPISSCPCFWKWFMTKIEHACVQQKY